MQRATALVTDSLMTDLLTYCRVRGGESRARSFRAYGRNEQMYSQMPAGTSMSKPDFAGTSKVWPAE